MKSLILLRHAKSDWTDTELSDVDRPLKRSGIIDAYNIGRRLQENHIIPQLVMSSPALRATHTSLIFCRQLNIHYENLIINPQLYGGSISSIMDELRQLKDFYSSVMLVGHEPILSDLYNFLTGKNKDKISTSGVEVLQFEEEQWRKVEGKAKVLFSIRPKDLLI